MILPIMLLGDCSIQVCGAEGVCNMVRGWGVEAAWCLAGGQGLRPGG